MRRAARQFLTRRDGAIAVEFALIAPIMVGMLFGLIELALALGIKGDVTNLASTGADLIAQESSATSSDMTNVFNALSAMLYPYSTTPAQITIYSVIDNNSGVVGASDPTGKVAWLCNQGGGAAYAKDAAYPLPAGVVTSGSNGSVIVAVVNYSYSLPVTITIPGIINLSGPYQMSSTFYSKPRRVAQIPFTGTC